MKKNSLFEKIRKSVSRIPRGKVLTYGDVAKLVSIGDARKVGWALHGNQDPNIPCHRVIKAKGYLAKEYSLGGREEQKRRLQSERVSFITDDQVDIRKHLWIP